MTRCASFILYMCQNNTNRLKKSDMKCKDFKNNMVHYIEKNLDIESAEMFEQHLKNCGSCNKLYKIFFADYQLIASDKITDSNPFFYSRVMAAIEHEKKTKPIFRFFAKKELILQFATYLIIVLFAIFTGYLIGNDKALINQEGLQNQTELSDLQLFADSHNLSFNEEDVYYINTNETEE